MKEENDAVFNYFVVVAKCGHVGKGKYIPVYFPIRARDAKWAAFHVRQKPGVKHHHSDAILSVRQVNYIEFVLFKLVFKHDLYWQRARRNGAALIPRVREEVPFHYIDKPSRTNKLSAKTNKKETRQFRIRRIRFIEQVVKREIEEEYGMII